MDVRPKLRARSRLLLADVERIDAVAFAPSGLAVGVFPVLIPEMDVPGFVLRSLTSWSSSAAPGLA